MPVAVVRDPRQAAPLCGLWDGEAGDYLGMEVHVMVKGRHTAQRVAVARAPAGRVA